MLALSVTHSHGFMWTTPEEIAVGVIAVVILLYLWLRFGSSGSVQVPDENETRLRERQEYLLGKIETYGDACDLICKWLAMRDFAHQEALYDALAALDKEQDISN